MTNARRALFGALLLVLAVPALGASGGVTLRTLSAIYLDDRGGGMKRPEGVAFDGRSLLAVADTGNGRILKFTVAGEHAAPAGEIRLKEIPCPTRIGIGPQGDLFVLDGKSRRIGRISPAGEFKGYARVAGDGPEGAAMPWSLAVDGEGRLLVLDVLRGRVLVLDAAGRTERTIAFPAGKGFPADIAVDGRGTIVAVDSVGRRVLAAGKSDPAFVPLAAGLQAVAAFPAAIAVDSLGRIHVADRNGDAILVLAADGSLRGRHGGTGWKEGLLRYPSGLCAGPAGTIFVADRENGRVQWFAASE